MIIALFMLTKMEVPELISMFVLYTWVISENRKLNAQRCSYKTIDICRLYEMLEGRLFLLSDLRCLQLRNGMETDGILLFIVFTTIRGTVGVIDSSIERC